MKNLKIGLKIGLGFSSMLLFIIVITITTVISSSRTGSNIDEVDVYFGMQNSANDLIHILNETRITTEVFYKTHSPESYADMTKQLMYSDFRLSELYKYIDTYNDPSGFRSKIAEFDKLYTQWRDGVIELGKKYNPDEPFPENTEDAFLNEASELRKINLIAHELLSNTILDIGDLSNGKTIDTKNFHSIALIIVCVMSVISLVLAIVLSRVIIKSITPPVGYMRDVLNQIGKNGDLQIPQETMQNLQSITTGKDETAQCASALLVMIDRLHTIDKLLSFVAEGDLTATVNLQSERDTMGLAVKQMLENLNRKFGTIAESTCSVKQKSQELSDGSRMLSEGSEKQSESVEHLSISVSHIVDKIDKNTDMAAQAASHADAIQENASSGTEQMNDMIQATVDINNASQSIAKVMKVIDDIAFQTNILALNAAIEAARAGQHGKGFSVVAEEVRNLANKSAEAAKNTSAMIENTLQKAALGSTIAQTTSKSLEKIVLGIQQSNSIISEITALSKEQSEDIKIIIRDVGYVKEVVEQNNTIASQSADAANDILSQSNILDELVTQFRLLE